MDSQALPELAQTSGLEEAPGPGEASPSAAQLEAPAAAEPPALEGAKAPQAPPMVEIEAAGKTLLPPERPRQALATPVRRPTLLQRKDIVAQHRQTGHQRYYFTQMPRHPAFIP